MARFSTGLRNAVAAQYGLGLMMNGGVIRIYGDERPASPDLPPGSTELGQITTEGQVFVPGSFSAAGLMLALESPGVLVNDGEWRLKGSANGIPIWWRWCWADLDPLDESTYYPRVDGLVGSELVLALTNMTASTDVEIEQFAFALSMGV